MTSATHLVGLALLPLAALGAPLVGCDKGDETTVRSDPVKLQPEGAKPAATSTAWAQPDALCLHTVGVCDANETCLANKSRMNAAGIHVYQLFDVDCEKSLLKRQQVLGASYEACAACLRDAADPKSVQACMFAGGPCH